MLPSSVELVRFVKEHPHLKTRDIASRLDVSKDEFDDFVDLMLRLQLDGSLLRVPLEGWDLPERSEYRVGRLEIDRRGQGFVRVAPGSIKEDDIFVGREDLGNAYDGDMVLVRAGKRPRRPGRVTLREGKVVDVVQRSRRAIRGRFSAGPKGGFVMPEKRRGARNNSQLPLAEIYVSPEETDGASDGEAVLVRLSDGAPYGVHPRGKIVARLAEEGSHETDLKIIAALFELPGEHPKDALKEAEKAADIIHGKAWPGRVDLRGELIFTIDPVDAKDFDDAVSLEHLAGGSVRLGVHIADVSYYVKNGSALDKEAEGRGTSVYLPGRVIPMLPERLSNNLASLRPDEDRLTKTVRMTFGSQGNLKKTEVFRSVIRSQRRFTYEEVLAALELIESGKAPAGLPADHAKFEGTLRSMARLRDQLHAERHQRGALYLDIPRLRLALGQKGEVLGIERDARDPSHALIEELMLAANEAVASYLVEKKLPLVARVHPPPEDKKLEEFRKFLKVFNLRLGGKGGSRDLQKLVEKVTGNPLSPLIQLALLRTMGHAEYVMGPGLHFALAATRYCHFTSPIRRYPDLLIHQLLDEHFDGQLARATRRREWDQRLPHAAERASALERRAEEAEREMTRLRLIRYLEPMVGEKMDAWIVSIHPFGFFVRVEETLVEGLVHVATLDDDYFEFDREKLLLLGRKSRRRFAIGDHVRVELSEVDVDLREISFRFVKRLGGHKGDDR
jgi:ribonuclease R